MLRSPVANDQDAIASLWYAGWHDAHAALMPRSVLDLRSLQSFRSRLPTLLADAVVAEAPEGIVAFAAIKHTELYQFYVASARRGTGLAGHMIQEVERRMALNGVRDAHLFCALRNERASRFYTFHGWRETAFVEIAVDTEMGPGPMIPVLRFEKTLG